MYCNNCGTEIHNRAVICVHCGVATNAREMTVGRDTGNLGIVGFVLAVVAMILPLAYVDILIGIAAFIFSLVSLTKNQNGVLAIAGIVISIIAIIGAITLLFVAPEFYWF